MKRWFMLILPLVGLVACADPGGENEECNAWLDGKSAELELPPGSAAYISCTSVARTRAQKANDKRSKGGP